MSYYRISRFPTKARLLDFTRALSVHIHPQMPTLPKSLPVLHKKHAEEDSSSLPLLSGMATYNMNRRPTGPGKHGRNTTSDPL